MISFIVLVAIVVVAVGGVGGGDVGNGCKSNCGNRTLNPNILSFYWPFICDSKYFPAIVIISIFSFVIVVVVINGGGHSCKNSITKY